MLRYLRRLADRDFALDRGMIPLGSCTMKLNATTEMVAVTWPEFAQIHPFAPHEQTRGIRGLVDELSGWLCQITGLRRRLAPAECRFPGELSGLLAIAAYHRSRGDDQRTVCLIPSSAHGTNAASAVMAGLRVVVVKTDPVTGNVDMDDLKAKVEQHRDTPGGDHGDLPVDARRLRGHHHRPVRPGARRRRPGVRRRRQPQRARRRRTAREVRGGRLAPQPPQDLLHPARGRGPGRRTGRPAASTSRPSSPTTLSTTPPGRRAASGRCPPHRTARRASCRSRGPTSVSWVARACGARPRSPCSTPTTSRPGCATTTRSSTRASTVSSPTSASSTCAASRRRPA